MSSQRPRGAPQRKITSRAKRLSLQAFTEGEATEVIYLTHWNRLYRNVTLVHVSPFHGDPLSLVREACDQKKRDLPEAKRGRGDAYDQYWCAFDVNSHQRIPEALDMAAANGVEIALTNPCIELWFVLHLEEQTAELDRFAAQKRAKELLGCGKRLTAPALAVLEANHDAAVNRAKANTIRHLGNGLEELANPASSMWRLVETIRNG